jgi:predicted transcriptional regulator of viral defense system
MPNTISLAESFRRSVFQKHDKPVVSRYELVRYIYNLYQIKSYDGLPIGKITVSSPDARVINKNINDLFKQGLLRKIEGADVYALSSWPDPTPQQILCTINPFCFLSHFSAMEWHGITDRIPKVLHATTCTAKVFRLLASQQQQEDFDGLSPATISRVIPQKLEGRRIEFHGKTDFTNVQEQQGSGGVRISSLGRTYLDMLKAPEWCGGFKHVLAVFDEYAESALPLIVREVDRRGNSMDKARAGYILEERLGLSHPTIEQWKENVQRGGSRKLVSSDPYSQTYSETWFISINLR